MIGIVIVFVVGTFIIVASCLMINVTKARRTPRDSALGVEPPPAVKLPHEHTRDFPDWSPDQ